MVGQPNMRWTEIDPLFKRTNIEDTIKKYIDVVNDNQNSKTLSNNSNNNNK